MAGDWMKIEKCTPDKPEVIQVASTLGISQGDAFVACFRVWRWFDDHTVDGNARAVTTSDVDRNAGVRGIADAMAKTTPKPWLVIDAHGVYLPHFDRHNGSTAKKRALTRNRVAKHRNVNSVTTSTSISNSSSVSLRGGTGGNEKPRERDPIWDTVAAEYFGGNVAKNEETRCGKLIAGLKRKKARAEEIPVRRQRLVDLWTAKCDTPESLVKHWDKFDGRGPVQARPGRATAPPGKYAGR